MWRLSLLVFLLVAVGFQDIESVVVSGSLEAIPADAISLCNATADTVRLKISRKCNGDVDSSVVDATNFYLLSSGSANAKRVCQRHLKTKICLYDTFLNCTSTDSRRAISNLIKEADDSLSSICSGGVLASADVEADFKAVTACLAKNKNVYDELRRVLASGARPKKNSNANAGKRRRRRQTSALDTLKNDSQVTETALINAMKNYDSAVAAGTSTTALLTILNSAFQANHDKQILLYNKLKDVASAALQQVRSAQSAALTRGKGKRKTLSKTRTIKTSSKSSKSSKGSKSKSSNSKTGTSGSKGQSSKQIKFKNPLSALTKVERRAYQQDQRKGSACNNVKGFFNFVCKKARQNLKSCENFDKVKRGLIRLAKWKMPANCKFSKTVCPGNGTDNRSNRTRANMCAVGLFHNKRYNSNDLVTCREFVTGDFEVWFESDRLKVEIKRGNFTPKAGSSSVTIKPQHVSEVNITFMTDNGKAVDYIHFGPSDGAGPKKFALANSLSLKKGDGASGNDKGLSKKITSSEYSIDSSTGTKIKDMNSAFFIVIYSNLEGNQRVYNWCIRGAQADAEEGTGIAASGCRNPADNTITTSKKRRRRRQTITTATTANEAAEKYDANFCTNCDGTQSFDTMQSDAEEEDSVMLAGNSMASNILLIVSAIIFVLFYQK